MITLGTSNISKLYVGETPIKAAYLSEERIFPATPAHTFDGLLAYFDAIDNEGTGVHNPSPTGWYDLVRGIKATVHNCTWGPDYITTNGGNSKIVHPAVPIHGYTFVTTNEMLSRTGTNVRVWGDGPSTPCLYYYSTRNWDLGFYGQNVDNTIEPRIKTYPNRRMNYILRCPPWTGGTVEPELFINGVKIPTPNVVISTVPGSPTSMWIACRGTDNARTMHGNTHEHLIYNRPLSDAEVANAFAVAQDRYGVVAD